jgi:hypothetical protein
MLENFLTLEGIEALSKEQQQEINGEGNCCLTWCAPYCQYF